MAEFELTRSKDDRRLFELGALGTLRRNGFASRRATAESAGRTWQLGRVGWFGRGFQAVGSAGVLVGEFDPGAVRRGGELRWSGRRFELRPASRWRERYALAVGDEELALFEAKGWGRRPVKVEILRAEAIEPGLILFAAFVAAEIARDSAAAASG